MGIIFFYLTSSAIGKQISNQMEARSRRQQHFRWEFVWVKRICSQISVRKCLKGISSQIRVRKCLNGKFLLLLIYVASLVAGFCFRTHWRFIHSKEDERYATLQFSKTKISNFKITFIIYLISRHRSLCFDVRTNAPHTSDLSESSQNSSSPINKITSSVFGFSLYSPFNNNIFSNREIHSSTRKC